MIPDRIPESLAFLSPKRESVRRARVLVFEIEYTETDGFETEIFVDADGSTLFTVAEFDNDSWERTVEEDTLTKELKDSLRGILRDVPLCRVQQQQEWGASVLAAKWTGPMGPQELKLLKDGSLLNLELARESFPVPEAVQHLARSADDIEPMVLDVYWIEGASPDVVYLANGWPVRRPRGTL